MKDDHITLEHLRRGLVTGFDRETSLRVLIHLGGGCPTCPEVIAALTSDFDMAAADGVAGGNGKRGGGSDPVARAIESWIGALRGYPCLPVNTTPTHIYWVRQLPSEPTVFPRVVLDEAFLDAVDSCGANGAARFEDTLRIFTAQEIRSLGDSRRNGLIALAQSYRDYVSGNRPGLDDAAARLCLTISRVGQPGVSSEIKAMVWLLESEICVFGASFSLALAQRYLDRFLAKYPSPGHQATLALHQGMALLREKRFEQACVKFSEAVAMLPEECVWLRFQAARLVVRASYAAEDYDLARRHLPEAEKLSVGFDRCYQSDLLWLAGNLDRVAGRLSSAEEKLALALDRLRDDGYREQAAFALRDLARVSTAAGRPADPGNLRKQLHLILRKKDVRPWAAGGISRVLRLAEDLGISDLSRRDLFCGPDQPLLPGR